MPGFPNVPTRQQFGPTYENRRPVQNPNRELGADAINLLMWQIAGASRVVAQATVLYDLAAEAVLYQAFAFDPDAKLADLTVAKSGTGIFTATFDPTYKDQNGADIDFRPRMALGAVQQSSPIVAGLEAASFISNLDVTIEVRDTSAVLVDRVVLLQVW